MIDQDQMKRRRVQNVLEMTTRVVPSIKLYDTIKEIEQHVQELSPSELYALACSRLFLDGVSHEASRVLWVAVMVAAW